RPFFVEEDFMLGTEPISAGTAIVPTAPVREGSNALPPPASTRVLEIELSQPLPILTAFDKDTQLYYERVLCLIRLHTQPLGILLFPIESDELLPQDYAPAIWHTFQRTVLEHLEQDGLPPVDEINVEGLPFDDLPRCLAERERFLADAP